MTTEKTFEAIQPGAWQVTIGDNEICPDRVHSFKPPSFQTGYSTGFGDLVVSIYEAVDKPKFPQIEAMIRSDAIQKIKVDFLGPDGKCQISWIMTGKARAVFPSMEFGTCSAAPFCWNVTFTCQCLRMEFPVENDRPIQSKHPFR